MRILRLRHQDPKAGASDEHVADAGGWLDTGTLQHCYQLWDLDTLRSVVGFGRPQVPGPRWLQVRRRVRENQLSNSPLTHTPRR